MACVRLRRDDGFVRGEERPTGEGIVNLMLAHYPAEDGVVNSIEEAGVDSEGLADQAS